MDADSCLLRLLEAQRARRFRAYFALLTTILFLAVPPVYGTYFKIRGELLPQIQQRSVTLLDRYEQSIRTFPLVASTTTVLNTLSQRNVVLQVLPVLLQGQHPDRCRSLELPTSWVEALRMRAV